MMTQRILLLVGTARNAVGEWRERSVRGRRRAASRPTPVHREIFVLTPEEIRTVCFVLLAFVLGLATKCYRDAHPRPLPRPDTKVPGHSLPHHSGS